MGYAVSKKDHDMWDVESEIYFRGRPVYMTGDRKNFIGITWKGMHGFVMVRKNMEVPIAILWSIL